MKTACDIKAVLFDENEKDNEITAAFLDLRTPEFIAYATEQELSCYLQSLQKRGLLSKEVIILKKFLGRFHELCPGSPNVICCNYRVINTCFNCLFDCAYCFLNTYLNSYGIMQFTNIDDLLADIDDFLKKCDKDKIYRIGSGEFTDSLMMDKITGIGKKLIDKLSAHKNIMLELKTKAGNIDHLLNIREKGNAVLAWSLNTERNIALYEHGTAALDERIACAGQASEAGYFLAFHFDPIIIYDGWEEDYTGIIDKLNDRINPERTAWISLGCFRHSPGFKDVLREKFPDEELTVREMFPGTDGKFRYLKKNRVEIYTKMIDNLREVFKKPYIYLCMETADVWKSALDSDFASSSALEKDFGDYLKNTFHIAAEG